MSEFKFVRSDVDIIREYVTLLIAAGINVPVDVEEAVERMYRKQVEPKIELKGEWK